MKGRQCGCEPLTKMADRVANIGPSASGAERLEMGCGIVLVNDCHNANPVSMCPDEPAHQEPLDG